MRADRRTGAFACLATFLALPAAAQELTWQGEVDGVALIRIHGNRVDADAEQGLPVQRQRFQFRSPLPQTRQDVHVEVIEGRGRVRLVEQPRPENNYTLAVRIEDRQGGSSFYSLEFSWESRGGGWPPQWQRGRPAGGRTDTIEWSGRVDGEAVITCRRQACEPEVRAGQPVMRDRYRFSRALPRRDVTVSLEETGGRGEIRLLEQPRESNDFAARVLIRDRQGGGSDYHFVLAWTPPARGETFDFARRGMTWSGRVDGAVRLVISGGSAQAEVVSGQPVQRERASFERRLPARDNPNVTVRKLHGRGRVEIVEYPSARNGYRIVVQIEDRDGGADDYEIEVGW